MNLDESLARLRQFITGLHEQSGPSQEKSGSVVEILQGGTYFQREGYGDLGLIGAEHASYRKCLHDICELATKKELVGPGSVESHVQTAVLKALDAEGRSALDFERRLSDALAELKRSLLARPVPWELHLQVLGLSADSLPMQFGSCRFYLADEPLIAELYERITSEDPAVIVTTGTKPAQADRTLEMLRNMMVGGTWCQVHVEAVDKDAALRLAGRRLRLTTDAINFFADLTRDRTRLFLPGDAGPSPRFALRIPPSGSTPDMTRVHAGPLHQFSFAQISPAMKRFLELRKVSEWLEKSRPSGLQDRILSALQWAGRAAAEERREESFLLYAISLESLLLGGQSHSELTESLALRGAHLLSGDRSARENVYKELKILYRIRSKIVHSGSLEVTDDELARISAVVRGALVTILHLSPLAEMTEESQLEDWFKGQLLGGTQVRYEKAQH